VKFVPVTVMAVPTGPLAGVKLVIVGACAFAAPANMRETTTERRRVFQKRAIVPVPTDVQR
jgi:hypothetical protein